MFPELGKKTESEREREREISKRKIKRREEKGMENSKFCSLYLSTVLLFYIYLSIKSQSKRIFENQCFKFLLILVNNARMESCLGCTAAFASVFFFDSIKQKGSKTAKKISVLFCSRIQCKESGEEEMQGKE